jgi:hypothetical protein
MCNETLTITKGNALKAFNEGTAGDKQLLNRLFGEKTFVRNLLETVFDFGAVCAEAGVNQRSYDLQPGMSDEEKHELFARKMRLIYRVFNGPDWNPDFSNDKQPKYYPWFRFTGGGFVLGDVDYYYGYAYVSARLCAKNEAIVRHICKYFLNEYNDYLLS